MNRRNNELSRADRDALRAALESKRAELVRAHEENLSVGTHSEELAADPMDAATRATEEAELLGLASQERALLAEIDRALAKMADGTYGVSERSGVRSRLSGCGRCRGRDSPPTKKRNVRGVAKEPSTELTLIAPGSVPPLSYA